MTVSIAAVPAVWAAYAFAGAGLLPRPPLLRHALVAISGVYLLRGLVVLPMLAFRPALVTPFWWWSSAVVLGYGVIHAVGVSTAWRTLA